PMEEINLHFTGDLHAITTANNLLAAVIDNHIYWGNALELDQRRITWRRALDMNDRALRQIVAALGGASNGYPREDGFDITVASEVMAIFCLATSYEGLRERLANIIVGWTRDRRPVRASDLKAAGAMAALLKEALKPNLVQTMEHNPAFVHGGPFANIAHGCNSAIATALALRLADYVITEAGFGADLGAEKFFDIKCRKTGLRPDAAVLVATVRALKMHGGVGKSELGRADPAAVIRGFANLRRHLENLARFGVPSLVAINRFWPDSDAELAAVQRGSEDMGVSAIVCEHFAKGGAGTEDLAHAVAALADSGTAKFRFLYPDELPLAQKIETIATTLYGARGIELSAAAAGRLREFEEMGFGHFPVCMAKTQYSFSTDPELRGAPSGFTLPVREVRLSAGAGFIVVICGEIMTMPGLPRVPSAERVNLSPNGQISGLS
ncbi:MAG: formate--tetrahydrofolate ligase, partial [Acetobacteraceae bacterium]